SSPSLPRQPDTEGSSPRAPEVQSVLGLAVDAQRRADPLPWRRPSGMETITTGHFQSLACRHSFSVHLTGLTCDGCAECLPAQDGVIVLLGGWALRVARWRDMMRQAFVLARATA